MKKIPMRMCVICREKKNKSELIRIVNNAEDGVCEDASGKMNGRGAYVCTDAACIESPKARKALCAALKTEISDDVFESIRHKIQKGPVR